MDGSGGGTLFGWPVHPGPGVRSGAACVIGVPADHGNGVSRGAARAPMAIRQAAAAFPRPRHAGLDLGDIPGCAASDLDTVLARLAGATERVMHRGMLPLIIGGDHSITYAPISVLQRRTDIGVVWFDAHTDFSPWSDGQVHSHKQVLRRIEALPGVARLVQVGYRGLTAGDERQLGDKASVVTSEVARTLDAAAVLALMPADLAWYVSIDIDVVDPFHAPGTSAPVPEGIEPTRLRELLAAIVAARTLLGADIVEVNPRLDIDDVTSRLAADLLWTIADGLEPPGVGR